MDLHAHSTQEMVNPEHLLMVPNRLDYMELARVPFCKHLEDKLNLQDCRSQFPEDQQGTACQASNQAENRHNCEFSISIGNPLTSKKFSSYPVDSFDFLIILSVTWSSKN